jgi:uncharacterized protein
VVIIGVLFLTRLLAHHAANRQSNHRTSNNPQKKTPRQTETLGKPEEMVRCASCGVYLPQSDAVKQNDKFWCSPDHAASSANTNSTNAETKSRS